MDNIINQCDKSDKSDNSENSNNEEKIKKTRNRLTKKQQFVKERKELIEKLNGIIGIDDKKNYVYLYDLENDQDVLKKIENMVEDIKKYHKCGTWGYFSNDLTKGKGNEIGLLRAVYKDNDILITTKNKVLMRNDKRVNSTVYYFNKIVK